MSGSGEVERSRMKVRKARKAHPCCECPEVIPSGSRYSEAKGCVDGKWSVWRTCLRCEYDAFRAFRFLREIGLEFEHRFPAAGELRQCLRALSMERTGLNEVPDDFAFGWQITEWAEESKAALTGGQPSMMVVGSLEEAQEISAKRLAPECLRRVAGN